MSYVVICQIFYCSGFPSLHLTRFHATFEQFLDTGYQPHENCSDIQLPYLSNHTRVCVVDSVEVYYLFAACI